MPKTGPGISGFGRGKKLFDTLIRETRKWREVQSQLMAARAGAIKDRSYVFYAQFS
jgi:hypothetical protein